MKPIPKKDIYYFRQRQRNRAFEVVLRHFLNERAAGFRKKDLAALLEKDPSQITRWLGTPGNLKLDTISDLLLAMGAELTFAVSRIDDVTTTASTGPSLGPIGAGATTSTTSTSPPSTAVFHQ